MTCLSCGKRLSKAVEKALELCFRCSDSDLSEETVGHEEDITANDLPISLRETLEEAQDNDSDDYLSL